MSGELFLQDLAENFVGFLLGGGVPALGQGVEVVLENMAQAGLLEIQLPGGGLSAEGDNEVVVSQNGHLPVNLQREGGAFQKADAVPALPVGLTKLLQQEAPVLPVQGVGHEFVRVFRNDARLRELQQAVLVHQYGRSSGPAQGAGLGEGGKDPRKKLLIALQLRV